MSCRLIRVVRAILFAALLPFASACDEKLEDVVTGPSPLQADVQMLGTTFSPADVAVRVGGTVRWINATPTFHTITPNTPSQAGAWTSQNVPAQQGFIFSHTFNTAGDFNYLCRVHAGMTGVVRVQ